MAQARGNEEDSVFLQLRIDPRTKKDIQKYAEAHDMTISAVIRKMINQIVSDHRAALALEEKKSEIQERARAEELKKFEERIRAEERARFEADRKRK